MTVTYGFYDSLSGDRRYNAAQFSKMFDAIINDGVFGSIGTSFQVLAGTGLQVTVGIGRSWFDHSWTYNDAVLPLTISTAHMVLDRIDTVVIETDSSEQVRANSIKVVVGTPASTPVPPTLTHTSTLNQYPLAHVLVPHGSTQILQGNITNKVGSSDCPLVTGILEVMDTDVITAQWQAEFELWFEFLQNELDANQAANLQAQILEHDHSDPLQTLIPTGGLMDSAVSLLKLASDVRFQKLFQFAGDGVNDFDWQNIPQTFTHLLLIYSGLSTRTTGGWDDIFVRVNNDPASNYHTTLWVRDNISEKWQWGITNPHNKGLYCGILPTINAGYLDSGSGIVLIGNYKGTTLYKSSISLSSFFGSQLGLCIAGGEWKNAAAIVRLTSYMTAPDHPRAGSLFTLYGFN